MQMLNVQEKGQKYRTDRTYHSKIRLVRAPSTNILLRGRFGARALRLPVRILRIASSKSPRPTDRPVARP